MILDRPLFDDSFPPDTVVEIAGASVQFRLWTKDRVGTIAEVRKWHSAIHPCAS